MKSNNIKNLVNDESDRRSSYVELSHKLGQRHTWRDVQGPLVFEKLQRREIQYKIEIKPTMGDDYPNVFRQMQKNGADILLVDEYNGIGATEEQIIKFFETGNIRVFFLRDI